MRKLLVLAATAAGAAYAAKKLEEQRSQRDLVAAASHASRPVTSARGGSGSAWAAATDRPA